MYYRNINIASQQADFNTNISWFISNSTFDLFEVLYDIIVGQYLTYDRDISKGKKDLLTRGFLSFPRDRCMQAGSIRVRK